MTDIASEVVSVNALSVDGDEAERFRTSFGPPGETLVDSVRRVGVLDPVIVRGPDQRVVCGFRRILAAREVGLADVPVRVLPAGTSDAQCLGWAVAHNLASGPVHLVEAARAAERWRALVGWPDDRLCRDLLPTLGLPPTREALARLDAVLDLPLSAQEALAAGRLDASHVDLLARFDTVDRARVCRLVTERGRFTHSETLEVLRALSDVCRRDGVTPAALLANDTIGPMLEDSGVETRARGRRLREWLRAKRMPRLTAWQERLDTLLSRLKLPATARIQVDRTFERDDMQLMARLRRPADWVDLSSALAKAGQQDTLAEIFRCLCFGTTDEHR